MPHQLPLPPRLPVLQLPVLVRGGGGVRRGWGVRRWVGLRWVGGGYVGEGGGYVGGGVWVHEELVKNAVFWRFWKITGKFATYWPPLD